MVKPMISLLVKGWKARGGRKQPLCVRRHASHAHHGSVRGDSGAKTQPLISPSIPHPAEHS